MLVPRRVTNLVESTKHFLPHFSVVFTSGSGTRDGAPSFPERFGGISGGSRSRLVEISGTWEILEKMLLQVLQIQCEIGDTSAFLLHVVVRWLYYQAENQVIIVNNETYDGAKSWASSAIPSRQHDRHAPQNQARGYFCDRFQSWIKIQCSKHVTFCFHNRWTESN